VALVEECLKDARATAKSAGEKLPWLECLPKGIRESERLAAHLKRWEESSSRLWLRRQLCRRQSVNNIYYIHLDDNFIFRL
jgi:hypothetical protein